MFFFREKLQCFSFDFVGTRPWLSSGPGFNSPLRTPQLGYGWSRAYLLAKRWGIRLERSYVDWTEGDFLNAIWSIEVQGVAGAHSRAHHWEGGLIVFSAVSADFGASQAKQYERRRMTDLNNHSYRTSSTPHPNPAGRVLNCLLFRKQKRSIGVKMRFFLLLRHVDKAKDGPHQAFGLNRPVIEQGPQNNLFLFKYLGDEKKKYTE